MGDGAAVTTGVGRSDSRELARVQASAAGVGLARRQLELAEQEHRLAQEALAATRLQAATAARAAAGGTAGRVATLAPLPRDGSAAPGTVAWTPPRGGSQPPPGPTGPPRPTADTARPAARPTVPAAVVLLVVGAVLLLSAAAVFVALSWRDLGVVGQAAVLAVATVVAAGVTAVLRRARLRAATEALAGVTAGLLVLDLAGARTFDLLGLGSVDGAMYVAVAATVVALLGAVAAWASGRDGRRITIALVLACAAVPVATLASVVQVASQVERGQGWAEGPGLLVEGWLEGFLGAGLVLLVLSRPVARLSGGHVLQRTLLLTGLVSLGLAGTLGVVVALWAPLVVVGASGPGWLVDRGGVLLRAAAVVAAGLLLSLTPTTRTTRRLRTTAAVVATGIGVGLLVTVLAAGAGLPRDMALVVAGGLVVVVALAPHRAQALRDGVVLASLLGALAGLVGLALALLVLLAVVEPAVGGATWSRPARGAVVAAVIALVPCVSVWRSAGPVRRLVDRLRPRLLTAVPALAAVVVAWQGVLLLPSPGLLAVAAVLSLLPVAGVGVVLTRTRLERSRWRLGWFHLDVVLPLVAVQLALGLLLVAAADDELGADGRAAGVHLVVTGAVAVLVAVVGTRGGPRRAAGRGWLLHPARRRAQLAVSVAALTGTGLIALGTALLVGPADLLLGRLVDGALAAGAVVALVAALLLLLPGWPAVRSGAAALGVVAASVAATGLIGPGEAVPLVSVWGGLAAQACGWALLGLTLAVQAVTATQPVAGWVPVRRPVLRHGLLPGPLVTVAVAVVVAVVPLLDPKVLDVTVLPAAAALLVLVGHVVAVVRLSPSSAFSVPATVRAASRDLAFPLLLGGLVTTTVVTLVPQFVRAPLQVDALPWLSVLATATVTCAVVLHRRDPALRVLLVAVGDVVLPLSAAATGLLVLVAVRPLTGLPVELESLAVTTLVLAVHLVRIARQRSRGGLPTAVTLRDLTTVASAAALGLLGVVAALLGDRPLWVPGLTWLVSGAAALVLSALVGGARRCGRSPGRLRTGSGGARRAAGPADRAAGRGHAGLRGLGRL